MNLENMSASEQDIETVREPEKQFGPTGTLKIQIERKEESGVHKRSDLPEINTPPKAQAFSHEPKVVINDNAKLVELRGGIVEVRPVQPHKFDVDNVEAGLKKVDLEIEQAQQQASGSSSEADRGLAFKRLTELKREKDKLEAQLPFAKNDELEAVDKDLNYKVDRYHDLLQRTGKSTSETEELASLTKNLPLLQAHRNQLKQSIEFKKRQTLSTSNDKMTWASRMGNRIKSLFSKQLYTL